MFRCLGCLGRPWVVVWKPPAACRPPGFHRTTQGRKQAHLRSLPTKTGPKFHEKTPGETKGHENIPRERKKNENVGGRRKKKREILGGPAEGGPAEGAPAEGGPKRGREVRWPKSATSQIGQAKEGGQNLPKLAWPDQNRAGHQKSERPWPKSAKATRLAKVGPIWFRLT